MATAPRTDSEGNGNGKAKEGKRSERSDMHASFRHLAESIAEGRFVVPPRLLAPIERRSFVRQTLREDHQYRLHHRPEGARKKFDKLAKSPFVFFRGSALLFYRDLAGQDGHRETAFLVGDVHPDNFGVMPSADGTPFFGPNDFDEAFYGPFSWDIRRAVVGFDLAARERGWKRKKRRRLAHAFVEGYLERIAQIAADPREREQQYRIDNSPKLIRRLLEKAVGKRSEFLKKYLRLSDGCFRPSREIVPLSSHVDGFQKVIDSMELPSSKGQALGAKRSAEAKHFRVKDVALKKGSGTASLGLDRYYVLIEGDAETGRDDRLLELKQTRPSALEGLVPNAPRALDDGADRVVFAAQVQLVGVDPYYGTATIDGVSFLVREKSPFKRSIDRDDIDYDELVEYAAICGRSIANVHARSEEKPPKGKPSIAARIVASVAPKVFVHDMGRFAEHCADQVERDYACFVEDHRLGAFRPGRFAV